MDADASPEVLKTMEAAANIRVDDTITPRAGLSSDNSLVPKIDVNLSLD